MDSFVCSDTEKSHILTQEVKECVGDVLKIVAINN